MKNCLVIVDMQKGFINRHTENLPHKIAEFADKNPFFDCIAATQYLNNPETACCKLGGWKECMSGTAEADFVPDIIPYVDRIFHKTTYSGFTPEFKKFIKSENFNKLYFCGVNTDCCALATVLSCYDNCHDCAVIADLCASTLGQEKHDNALKLMADNITVQRIINSSDCKI